MIFLDEAVSFSFRNAYDLLVDKLTGWFVSFVRSLPNLAAVVILLLITFFLARLLKRIAGKAFGSVVKNKAIASLLSSIVFSTVFIAGIIVCLGILNLDKTVTSLLAGAGIIGLALTFAFQDVAQNFISGISMAIWKPFNIGDTIEAAGKRGVVRKINLRTTMLSNNAGELVIIPNKEVHQGVLINSSQDHGILIRIPFELPATKNLQQVRRRIIEILEQQSYIHDSTVKILFTDFAATTIKSEVRFFINRDADDATSRSEAIMVVKRILEESEKSEKEQKPALQRAERRTF